ncbi:MAG TPA: FAD-dependent oxidoreductase [Methylomirabilota bacterium]|nr:FAD-dependent oxidoreductase [Methylomirabilota bacterium]
MATVAIVGASLAGSSAAATLREEGFDGRVVLIGAEPQLPYDRPPLSKNYLRGVTPFEKTLLRPADFYRERDIEMRLGTTVTRVDAEKRTVALHDGERLEFDQLLIATGGKNRRFPIPGIDLPGVYDLRTVADADRIREAMARGGRAVVVGMGFIGAEVAAAMRQSGLDVVAIEPFKTPLYRALGEEIGRVVEGLHRDNGVEMILDDAVTAFEGAGKVERVVTRNGRRIDCSLAVFGLGIEPATELVAGTPVRVDNGIVVDDQCRTNVPGIFAAGDVANHYHPVCGRQMRVEHWQNGVKQGAAAARSMLGRGQTYDEVHWFWSDQFDANIQYAGFHAAWDQIVVRGSLESRKFLAFYLTGGRVESVVAINQGRDMRRTFPIIKARAAVDPASLADPNVDLRTLAPTAT